MRQKLRVIKEWRQNVANWKNIPTLRSQIKEKKNEDSIANSFSLHYLCWVARRKAKRGRPPCERAKRKRKSVYDIIPDSENRQILLTGNNSNKRSRKFTYERELLLYYRVSRCLPIPLSQIRRAIVCAFYLLGFWGYKICEDIAFRYICTCPL